MVKHRGDSTRITLPSLAVDQSGADVRMDCAATAGARLNFIYNLTRFLMVLSMDFFHRAFADLFALKAFPVCRLLLERDLALVWFTFLFLCVASFAVWFVAFTCGCGIAGGTQRIAETGKNRRYTFGEFLALNYTNLPIEMPRSHPPL